MTSPQRGPGSPGSPSQAGLALGKTVQLLMATENEVRNRAEADFKKMLKSNPVACLQGLVEVLSLSPDAQARKLAITLFKRYMFGEDAAGVLEKDQGLWEKPISAAFKGKVKALLLDTLARDSERSVRTVTCTVVATIAMVDLPEGTWPNLFTFLIKGASSNFVPNGNFNLAESCFEVIAMLGYYIGENLQQQLPQFRSLFENSLTNAIKFGEPGARVVGATVKALGHLMVCLQSAEHVELFQNLIPGILAALSHVIKHKLEDQSLQMLMILAEVAEEYARFFKPHLEQFMSVLGTITASEFVHEFEPKIRHIAVEIMVLLAERAPVMARRMKGNQFVLTSLQAILKLMMDQEDDPEWALRDDEEDDDMNDDGGDVGCHAIARLARAIRAKHFIGPALVAVRKWSTNPNWRCRSAAFLALSQLGEILPDDTEEHRKLVLYVLQFFKDPNPHVRYAAVHCMGQFSVDLAPSMQMDTHEEVFAASASVMGDFKAPRVQSHLLGSLSNFIDHCSERVLASHTEKLLKQLAAVLQHGRLPVQAQAITTLASVADRVSKSFQRYYASFAPVLKSVLVNPKVDAMTRGRTLECFTLIGEAVGKDMFRADALALMDLMVRLNAKEDTMLQSYIWAAWNRVCVALGPAEFERYLPLVVPTLLKHVAQPIKTSIDDVDENDEEKLANYQMVAGGTAVVNCLALEDQATAARTLQSLVRTMGAGYRNYINETVAKLVPLTVEAYFDDVKYAAIGALPCLIKSALQCTGGAAGATDAAMAHVRGIVDFIVKTLLKGLNSELKERPGGDMFDINIHFGYVAGLQRCLEAANGGSRILAEGKPPKTSLNLPLLESLVQTGLRSLQASFQRCAVIVAEGRVEERDEDALEVANANMKEEHALQYEVVDTLGTCIGVHPELMMQHMYPKYILPKIDEFSGEHRTSNDRKLVRANGMPINTVLKLWIYMRAVVVGAGVLHDR